MGVDVIILGVCSSHSQVALRRFVGVAIADMRLGRLLAANWGVVLVGLVTGLVPRDPPL